MNATSFTVPTLCEGPCYTIAEGLEQVREALSSPTYSMLALDATTWTWGPHKTGINLGATPTGCRDVYLVGIDYQTYRDLVVSIKEHHRARAASTGLMVRHSRHRGIHSERVVLTPREAVNRALPWCRNGKPLEGHLRARAYVDPGANKLGESSPPTATRAIPGYPGTPMYALDIWHVPDATGRFVRVWVASPAIRDAWIQTINKTA